jgi:hypothetical protein
MLQRVAAIRNESGATAPDLFRAVTAERRGPRPRALSARRESARINGHSYACCSLQARSRARKTIAPTAAHCEIDALRALLEDGAPMTAPMAAALGDMAALRALLANASASDTATAFGLAAINGRAEALRIALDAGADVNAYLPVHAHSTALHQAALLDRADLVELLLARGADPHVRERLWDSTPLDWAIHQNCVAARAALEDPG